MSTVLGWQTGMSQLTSWWMDYIKKKKKNPLKRLVLTHLEGADIDVKHPTGLNQNLIDSG